MVSFLRALADPGASDLIEVIPAAFRADFRSVTESLTDLQRFFRQLVRNLAATDPARLHRPLPLIDIRDSIVPYRANRRALELESSEDYELVLLQLCAGQGGLARTEPEDIRALFAAELRSTNPDLGLLHLYENAVVSLEAEPLAAALDPKPDLTFAPPGEPLLAAEPILSFLELPSLEPRESSLGPRQHPEGVATQCRDCGGSLPTHREVNFCPHCGGAQARTRCPACHSQVERDWRHCVVCGAEVAQG